MFSINPDAHSVAELDLTRWGVAMARKGGVPKESVLNCLDRTAFAKFLDRRRGASMRRAVTLRPQAGGQPIDLARPSVASRRLVLYSRRQRDRGKREWQRRGRWSGRMGARPCMPPPARSDGRTSASATGDGSIRFTRRPGSAAPNRSIRPCSATFAATGPAYPSAGPMAPPTASPIAGPALPRRRRAARMRRSSRATRSSTATAPIRTGGSSPRSAEALVIAVDYPEDSPVAGMTRTRAPGRRRGRARRLGRGAGAAALSPTVRLPSQFRAARRARLVPHRARRLRLRPDPSDRRARRLEGAGRHALHGARRGPARATAAVRPSIACPSPRRRRRSSSSAASTARCVSSTKRRARHGPSPSTAARCPRSSSG